MKRSVILFVLMALMAGALNAQVRTYTTSEEDSLECITSLSLYIEFFKQDNYKDAINGWRTATSICPKSTESLWVNGIKMYSDFIDKEEDAAKKKLLIDTLEWVYDQRIEHFGKDKEGYIRGRKGSDMMKYRSSNPKAAYDELSKSMEMQQLEMEPAALYYYYRSAYDLYRDKAIEKSVLFDLYAKCSEVVDHNMSGSLKNAYASSQANIDKLFVKVAECPDIVEIYTPKFKAKPTDVKLLKQILKTMDKRDCADTDLYLEVAVALFGIEPNAEAAYAIANGYVKKENYSGAIEFYEKAIAQTEDVELKKKALLKAANTALILKQLAKAKTLALQLLQLDPNSGDAYIVIGDAYLSGSKSCGDNACTQRAGYWAAYDKYARAKQVDGSAAETANKRMATAREQFPEKEECFFIGLTDGASYTVGCWINETTQVRTRGN